MSRYSFRSPVFIVCTPLKYKPQLYFTTGWSSVPFTHSDSQKDERMSHWDSLEGLLHGNSINPAMNRALQIAVMVNLGK